MDEDPLSRDLRIISVEIGASLRRQLLEQVEAIAAHERVFPAITWPIDDTAVFQILVIGTRNALRR